MYKNGKKSLDYIIDFNRIIFTCLCFSVLFINIFIYLHIFFIIIFLFIVILPVFFCEIYSLTCFMFAVLRVSPFSPSPFFSFFFFLEGGGVGGRPDIKT